MAFALSLEKSCRSAEYGAEDTPGSLGICFHRGGLSTPFLGTVQARTGLVGEVRSGCELHETLVCSCSLPLHLQNEPGSLGDAQWLFAYWMGE